MIYVTDGTDRYKCTAPEEHRINIQSQKRQWVIDFIICDSITPSKIDALLDSNELTFIYVDDKAEETAVSFDGYTKINSVFIKYEQDLSCTATVQLGKEVEVRAC